MYVNLTWTFVINLEIRKVVWKDKLLKSASERWWSMRWEWWPPIRSENVILALNMCEWSSLLLSSFAVPVQDRWPLQLCITCSLHPLKIGCCVTRWVWERSCGSKKINETCLSLPCPFEMPTCYKLQQRKMHFHLS